MPGIEMTVFTRPSLRSRSVIASEVAPAVRGHGSVDYACGECGIVLAAQIHPGQMQRIGFKCHACGVLSEPPVGPKRSGSEVLIPLGIYRITSALDLPANVILRGERSS
jgi:hypothetical protein